MGITGVTCMRGSGGDYLNCWYCWLARVGCLETTNFYHSVVSSIAGKSTFRKYLDQSWK